jgi:hypothetical protein
MPQETFLLLESVTSDAVNVSEDEVAVNLGPGMVLIS